MVSDGAGAGGREKEKNIRHRDSAEPRKFPKSQVKNTKGRDDPLPRIEQSEEGPSQDQGWMGLVVGEEEEKRNGGDGSFSFFFSFCKTTRIDAGGQNSRIDNTGKPR